MSTQVYPWFSQQWEYFSRLLQSGSFPHALLLHGPAGIGKHQFATTLCAALACDHPTEEYLACGKCKHCLLFEARTYPDFVHVELNEDESSISVDVIRAMISKLYLTRHYENPKVALIENADAMNVNAANAILKTLEEPPEDTILILVSENPQKLPATIRSRCQAIALPVPSEEQAMMWLQEFSPEVDWEPLLKVAQGGPLRALLFHETDLLDQRISVMNGFLGLFERDVQPLEISGKLASVDFVLSSCWIQSILLDLLRIKSAENPITLENPDFYRPLLALAPRLRVPLILEFWDLLLERKSIYDKSLNFKLFTESMVLQVHKLAARNLT
ncbi:MAG: DNA polymerase III subunit delta' [Pseudomonadota bacterium]